jgi:murein DD-endopeptidase
MRTPSLSPAVAIVLLLLLLTGCASAPSATRVDSRTIDDGSIGARVVRMAERQLGAPYRYGGAGPETFDCSGLVHYAYRQLGMSVPRTTAAQLRAARRVGVDALRTGDLVFFRLEGKISHVGLYAGDGRFIHAPSSGKHVSIAELSPYWRARLVAAGRLH